MKQTFLWIILLAFSACASSKIVYVPVKHTTLIVDTIVDRRADSSMINALIECDSNRIATIKYYQTRLNGALSADISLVDNALKVDTKWKTNIIERVVTKIDTVSIVQRVEVEVIKTKVPQIYKYCLYIVIGLIVIGVIKVAMMFRL